MAGRTNNAENSFSKQLVLFDGDRKTYTHINKHRLKFSGPFGFYSFAASEILTNSNVLFIYGGYTFKEFNQELYTLEIILSNHWYFMFVLFVNIETKYLWEFYFSILLTWTLFTKLVIFIKWFSTS